MWVLTQYAQDSIKMFEFENKEEARKEYEKMGGNKVLSEVIYFTDFAEADLMKEQQLSFS
ncbi:MAG TPA: hypothetical protein GX497_18195 [Bacillus bacterium]|nr:hypothetical protein [Bacillus sp. (in: firmicutes)]